MSPEIIRDAQTIVRVQGEIDLSNVAEFQDALREAAHFAPKGFIVDLTDVEYVDSAGVQAILCTYTDVCRTDGTLALVIGNPTIRSVLEVVHMEQLPGMSVCDALQDARSVLPNEETKP